MRGLSSTLTSSIASGIRCILSCPSSWVISMTLTSDIREFHKTFELTYEGKPRALPEEIADFRLTFLREELDEYVDATFALIDQQSHPEFYRISPEQHIRECLEKQLDALVDLVYVALGTAYLQGFDFDEAWRRVHAANMRKVRAVSASDSKRNSQYDVVKPSDWVPPSHADLVHDYDGLEEKI